MAALSGVCSWRWWPALSSPESTVTFLVVQHHSLLESHTRLQDSFGIFESGKPGRGVTK